MDYFSTLYDDRVDLEALIHRSRMSGTVAQSSEPPYNNPQSTSTFQYSTSSAFRPICIYRAIETIFLLGHSPAKDPTIT